MLEPEMINERLVKELETLRECEDRYRKLLDCLPDAIYIQSEGAIAFANAAAIELFGADSSDQLIGMQVLDLMHPDYRQVVAQRICGLKANRSAPLLQEKYLRMDGSTIHVEVRAVPCVYQGRPAAQVIARDVSERKEMEDQIVHAKNEWEETFDTLNEAITVHDADFNVIRANGAAQEMLGLPGSVITSRKCHASFHGTDHPPQGCPSCMVLKTGEATVFEMYEPHLGKFIQLKALPRFDADRKIIGIVHIVRDLTMQKKAEQEQKKLQVQFIQAQKMESIGRLAGGIAHDFNNILSAIMGYSELALLELPRHHPLYNQLKTINESGEKAATLTRQLLAFSRKQVLEMKVIELKSVISRMASMLCRMIGEDVTLELDLQAAPDTILADRNQIEQVLMNLVVNARDAMPEGGTLSIQTQTLSIEEPLTRQGHEMPQGMYVVIAVSDTGTGMSPDVKEKIFEPFFTTKDMGKGTGLGLATVYGIVKQHNGYIYVYSEQDLGSTFKVYLPLAAGSVETALEAEQTALAGGTETVMIVDDDPLIRELSAAILRPLGYNVLEVSGGSEALETSAAFEGTIHAVLTDIIMPKMHGKELADSLLRQRPGIEIVFMSGYTDDVIALHGVLDRNINFVAKPITPSVLTRKLRSVLDRRKAL